MKKKIVLALILTLAGTAVAAGLAGAEEPKVTKWYDKIQASGFVDAYYQLNFIGLSGGASGAINNPSSIDQRALDLRQNEFVFNGAKVSLATKDDASQVGAQLDLLYGPLGINSIGNGLAGNPVEQAFVTFPLGPVNFKVGKMVTHMSNEVIDTTGNWNYSRSILFTEVPYYHVGVMANYSPVSWLGIMAGLANGNSIEQANDETKDIMGQITYSQITNLTLTGNYYLESNRTTAGLQPFENTHYLELIGTYQATKDLGVALDYLYRTTLAAADKDAAGNATGDATVDPATGLLKPFSPKGQGVAVYVNYATPLTGLSVIPRVEYWAAPDTAPDGGSAKEYTLTVKYAQGPLTHWLELRSDHEGPAGFFPSAGAADLKSDQLTLTYAATYSF
jgi:hypothetical protein